MDVERDVDQRLLEAEDMADMGLRSVTASIPFLSIFEMLFEIFVKILFENIIFETSRQALRESGEGSASH